IEPETSGFLSKKAASFMRNLVGKLSEPSRTTSYPLIISLMLSTVSLPWKGSTFTSGLSLLMLSAAEWTLGLPILSLLWIIWRWRLLKSTQSPSAMPMVPTPAAARYRSAGEPRPPAPRTKTLLFSEIHYPSDLLHAYPDIKKPLSGALELKNSDFIQASNKLHMRGPS